MYDPSFGANLTLAAPGEGRGGKEIESLSHFWQGRFSRSGQMRQNYSACAEIFFTLQKKSKRYIQCALVFSLSTLGIFWQRHRLPNENLALGTSVFREFFSNFTEVLIILKMSKKRSNYESSVFLRICGGEKKDLFWFLAIFDKNTGHRVTKFYPDTRTSNTYKSYFIKFFLTRKKLFFVSLIYVIESSFVIEGQLE